MTGSGMNNLTFIGALNYGKSPTCGETAKNQILLEYLRKYHPDTIFVDTLHWKTSLLVLLRLFTQLVLVRDRTLIVSICSESAYLLSRLLHVVRRRAPLYYFVIGGKFADKIAAKQYSTKYYLQYTAIFVEGKEMLRVLQNAGLTNVRYLRNFKSFDPTLLDSHPARPIDRPKVRFVFLSRIVEEKGASLVLEAARMLNAQGFADLFDVSFYGPIGDSYEAAFQERCSSLSNATYEGILDLQSAEGYRTLASYDVMLFPTFWHGEGMAGVIIDAFIAGLPVVASDWHLNAEMVVQNETGYLVRPNDVHDLVGKMHSLILNRADIDRMSRNCLERAKEYHSSVVLDDMRF